MLDIPCAQHYAKNRKSIIILCLQDNSFNTLLRKTVCECILYIKSVSDIYFSQRKLQKENSKVSLLITLGCIWKKRKHYLYFIDNSHLCLLNQEKLPMSMV